MYTYCKKTRHDTLNYPKLWGLNSVKNLSNQLPEVEFEKIMKENNLLKFKQSKVILPFYAQVLHWKKSVEICNYPKNYVVIEDKIKI